MKTTLPLKLALSVCLAGTLVSCLAIDANAQISAPASTNPGLQSPTTTDQLPNPDRPRNYVQDQQAPAEKIDIDVPQSAPSVNLGQQRFMVNDVRVQGTTVFTEQDLQPLVAPFENREVSLDELGTLVEQINKKYRDKGYLTTQAYVPPQDIEGGIVTIQVLEGRIGNLEISGNKYYKTWAIEKNIEQQPGGLLNIRELEKALNRVNNQENFRLKATLSPGDEPGETDVRLDVAERQPWQITPTFDNQGRPFIGTYRWGVGVTNDNLLGIGDRLSTRWIGAAGTQVAAASYFLPVSRFGTELGFTFAYSYVDVDLDIPNQPEITGHAYNYGVILSQPFDKNRTFVGDIGMNFRRISSYIDDERTGRDDIRSLQAGLNFNKIDRLGRTFARGQFTVAPNWLGANTAFSKYELFVTRLFRLPANNLLILRGYSQLTPDALPTAEQMQIGGAFSVRGYTEGLLLGDRGYNFSVEHRWPIPFLRMASPWLADRLQGAFFFDIGQVWLDRSNRNYIGGFSNTAQRTTLLGTGVGLRFQLTRFLQGFVDAGFGLTNRSMVEPNAQPTARVHFGLRSDLLPDTYKQRSDETRPLRGKKSENNDDEQNSSAVPATTTESPETTEMQSE